jgi:hypothetical protein
LSITKKIAEAHQGRVWEENAEGGPTFYFAFPWLAAQVDAMQQQSPVMTESGTRRRSGGEDDRRA